MLHRLTDAFIAISLGLVMGAEQAGFHMDEAIFTVKWLHYGIHFLAVGMLGFEAISGHWHKKEKK